MLAEISISHCKISTLTLRQSQVVWMEVCLYEIMNVQLYAFTPLLHCGLVYIQCINMFLCSYRMNFIVMGDSLVDNDPTFSLFSPLSTLAVNLCINSNSDGKLPLKYIDIFIISSHMFSYFPCYYTVNWWIYWHQSVSCPWMIMLWIVGSCDEWLIRYFPPPLGAL